MVRVCVVKNCGNSDGKNVSLHSLPRDPIQRRKWLDILTTHGGLRERAKIGENTTVCDDHFPDSCFGFGLTGKKRRLLEGAEPSLRLGKQSHTSLDNNIEARNEDLNEGQSALFEFRDYHGPNTNTDFELGTPHMNGQNNGPLIRKAANKRGKFSKLKSTESGGNVKILGKNHSKCVADQILESWSHECYANVTFISKSSSATTGKCLRANKAVLAAGSRKLQLLLADTGDEDAHIFVPDSDFETTKLLIQYIYTGEVLVGQDRDVLESLIFEWEIGYPEITPVEPDSSTVAEITATNQYFSHTFSEPSPKKTDVITINVERPTSTFSDENDLLNFQFPSFEKGDNFLDDDFSNEVTKETERSTVDHGYTKSNKTKRKKVVKSSPDVESDATSQDVPAVADTQEDEADYLLSQAFLNQEKSISKKLTETSNELTEEIRRHEIYVNHFIGPLVLPPKPKRVGNENSEPKVPCSTCSKLISPSYMNTHLKTAHADERPFLCEQCGSSFPLSQQLKIHIGLSHPTEPFDKPHICRVCNKAFRRRNKMELHMTLHTGEKRFKCTYCDRPFRLDCVRKKHERTHTGEKPYLCNSCGKQFSTHSGLAQHMKSHEKKVPRKGSCGTTIFEEPFKCGTCGITFSREYAFLIHEASHTGEEPKLPCRHCPGIFPSNALVREHVKNNHPETFFSCDQCDNFYQTKTAFESHKKTHQETGTTYQCSVCEKQFKTKSLLSMHVYNVHSTNRPFKCRFCPKDFKVKKLLIEHDRVHTGERPYRCPHCPKDFRVETQYKLHLRTHTGEKPYSCSYCDKTFASRESKRMHTKIHTGDHIRCPVCSKIFPTHAKLRAHERIHSEEVEEEREDGEDDISDYMSEGEEEDD